MVVFAVDVGSDGTADGDLAGAGEDGDPEAVGEGGFHQLVEGDAGVYVNDGGVGVDAVNGVERLHVDDESTGVGGGVAVGAAAAAGDNTAFQVAGFRLVVIGDHTDGTDNLLRVTGGEYLGSGGLGASPAG